MNTYQYELTVKDSTEKDADTKANAAGILVDHLSAKEMATLADIVLNRPDQLDMFRKAYGLDK